MALFIRLWVVLVILAGLAVAPAQAEDGVSPHIQAKLITASETVAPNGDVMVALDYTPQPGWHTYWLNPGDTGLAPIFHWSLPDGVTAGEVAWPTPKLLPTTGLMSYGYEGRTVLLVPLHNASKMAQGAALPLHAKVDFLVCADICVPESLEVSLALKVGAAGSGGDPGMIATAEKALPLPSALTATVAQGNGVVDLGFAVPSGDRALAAEMSNPQGVYFFPEQSEVLNAPAAQALDMGADGFALHVPAAGDALPEGNLSGVLKFADGAAFAVKLTRAPLVAGVHGLGAAPASQTDTSFGGVLVAMGLAFIGGLILNLMPCVFPVLSMKLLALTRAGHDTELAQRESLVYGAGAVVSFVVLALILDVAHALGASLGWGFQLQSPFVTALLALVMLLVALNMAGAFEIGASLQRLGGNLQIDHNRPLLAAFLTGVLAVVVAAPCTAPFMATAIGVALAQGGLISFVIFLALGVGFAAPFVGLTFLITRVPAVARWLPKPGDWMISLRRGLSILMYAAAAWLVWVFSQQVGTGGLFLLGLALGAVAVGVMNFKMANRFVQPVLLVVGLIMCVVAAMQPAATRIHSMPSGLLPHRDFNIETLADLRARNTPVFVDLTAAWCVTCKVNENLVLKTQPFEKALKATGTVYMVGDWTNQDAAISHYLSLYGRSGVPLYVYYGPNKAAPVVLPQILQSDAVVKVLTSGQTR